MMSTAAVHAAAPPSPTPARAFGRYRLLRLLGKSEATMTWLADDSQAGTEVMLGIVRDPVFGPVVAAGLGGIHVEVLRDIAYRIAPVTADEAGRMLRELRGYRILEGVRGAKPADIGALVAAIVRLSWLAHDLGGELAELDINPLLVFENGAGVKVVDALLVRTA